MNNFSGLCAFQKDKSQNPGKHGNKFEAFEHVPQPTARGEAVFSTGFDYALQIVKSIIYWRLFDALCVKNKNQMWFDILCPTDSG